MVDVHGTWLMHDMVQVDVHGWYGTCMVHGTWLMYMVW
jgi:hypothetical protein